MNPAFLVLLFVVVATGRLVSYQQKYVYQYGTNSGNNGDNGDYVEGDEEGDGDDGDDGDEEESGIPSTSFSCKGKIDGYYADVEVDCEVFHYCQTWQLPGSRNKTVDWTFTCPETTIFNQELLTCTPENESFNCQDSPNHFDVNQNLTQTNNPVSQQDQTHGNLTQVVVSNSSQLYFW